MSGIRPEDGSDGREEGVEGDPGQVDEVKNGVQYGGLGPIYIVEVLLGKFCEGRIPQNDRRLRDTAEVREPQTP